MYHMYGPHLCVGGGGGGAYLKMGGLLTCQTMYHFMTIYIYKSNYLLLCLIIRQRYIYIYKTWVWLTYHMYGPHLCVWGPTSRSVVPWHVRQTRPMSHFMTRHICKSNYLLCMFNYQIRIKNTNITGETITYFDWSDLIRSCAVFAMFIHWTKYERCPSVIKYIIVFTAQQRIVLYQKKSLNIKKYTIYSRITLCKCKKSTSAYGIFFFMSKILYIIFSRGPVLYQIICRSPADNFDVRRPCWGWND
jgi:hypothetical protein